MNAESTPDLEEERQKNGKEGEELSRQVELLKEKRAICRSISSRTQRSRRRRRPRRRRKTVSCVFAASLMRRTRSILPRARRKTSSSSLSAI